MSGLSKLTSIGGTKNKIYNSAYKELAWSWLYSGQSPSQVQRALRDKGFDVSLPVVLNFQKIMEDEYRRQQSAGLPLNTGGGSGDFQKAIDAIPTDQRIMNDGELLDLIIQRFMQQVQNGTAELTAAVALKAISMKKDMLGAKYKGQTVWSLMEAQMQFDKLTEILEEVVTHDQFQQIMAKMENIGLVTTQKPAGIEPDLNLDRAVDTEAGMVDPTDAVY